VPLRQLQAAQVHCHISFTISETCGSEERGATLYRKCVVAIARALRDPDAPPHIVRAVAEACASVNARFPLQRFYDIAVGESVRQTIIKYHSKDDEASRVGNPPRRSLSDQSSQQRPAPAGDIVQRRTLEQPKLLQPAAHSAGSTRR
jgi:hypothetical protein